MKTTEWYADSKTFNYNNWGIKYKTGGDEGEILLLIHGFPTSSWDWQKIWPKLTKSYAVVAPDLLGFGQSDKPNGHNYTIHEQAKILESLMLNLGHTKFHILAHDYGNTVTQEMLAAFLERNRVEDISLNILSICFLNGGIFPEMHRPVLTQKLLHSRFGFLFNKFLTFKSLEKNLIKVFGPETAPSLEDLNGFWELINYNNGRSNMHRLIKYIRDRREHRERWVGALMNTSIPIRLIDGPEDPVSGKHLIEYYKKMVPDADVIELPNIGHYPQTEAPEDVLYYYFQFRNQH